MQKIGKQGGNKTKNAIFVEKKVIERTDASNYLDIQIDGLGRMKNQKPKEACVEVGPNLVPWLTDEQYKLFIDHFKEEETNESRPRANLVGRNSMYDGWVINSVVTEHITHIVGFLNNEITNPKEIPIIIPNGDKVLVVGEGEHTLP